MSTKKSIERKLSKLSKPAKHFTHFDRGGAAHMVDIGDKSATHRVAIARGSIAMQSKTLSLIRSGTAKKGDVLGIARIAAIQGTKNTSALIPLAHPIGLTSVSVKFELFPKHRKVDIEVTAETYGQTGVEMEALTGAAIGLLTIYDMCKAVDRGMTISNVYLVEKSGGRSGRYVRGRRSED